MNKRKNRVYSDEFKQEAVALTNEQGYSVREAAKSLGVDPRLLYEWRKKWPAGQLDNSLSDDERAELKQLRKENKRLLMEKEILKKAATFFAKETQ